MKSLVQKYEDKYNDCLYIIKENKKYNNYKEIIEKEYLKNHENWSKICDSKDINVEDKKIILKIIDKICLEYNVILKELKSNYYVSMNIY